MEKMKLDGALPAVSIKLLAVPGRLPNLLFDIYLRPESPLRNGMIAFSWPPRGLSLKQVGFHTSGKGI